MTGPLPPAAAVEPRDVRRAQRPPAPLGPWVDAGVLAAADVHVAARLCALAGEDHPDVLLAAALAVRGPRVGHVHVDLATIHRTATGDADEPVDLAELPWPEPGPWLDRVAASALCGEEADPAPGPLRRSGTRLALDRYSREERQVAADLHALASSPPGGVDEDVLARGLDRLFGEGAGGRQRLAAASAVLRRLAVIAGGPGTGKTTTVARVLALVAEQRAAAGAPPPLVALAAPTGKAAARLEESVHAEAARLPVDPVVRDGLLGASASTLHRLLGRRPDSHSRFRHDRGNRLPHDVVVVDECSMVSLSLMARLAEAVRPDARLVLVGDPGQLTSIEAGAVLGDVVGPATGGLRMRPEARDRLAEVAGIDVEAAPAPGEVAVGDGIVVLDRVHRFGGRIAGVAEAIRAGDADGLVELLRSAPREGEDADGAVEWLPTDAGTPDGVASLGTVRERIVAGALAVGDAARAGDAAAALGALGQRRVLCAHRRGAHGVSTWTARIEGWLAAERDDLLTGGRWYPGRPLLVTENDPALRLHNGDTGVVVAGEDGRPWAAFERRGGVHRIGPARLEAVDTVHAMTVHKSQGSQFDEVVLVLPPATSRVLTRELLYTAVTRARRRLVVLGPEETLRAAVDRPIARASGLGDRLWGP